MNAHVIKKGYILTHKARIIKVFILAIIITGSYDNNNYKMVNYKKYMHIYLRLAICRLDF